MGLLTSLPARRRRRFSTRVSNGITCIVSTSFSFHGRGRHLERRLKSLSLFPPLSPSSPMSSTSSLFPSQTMSSDNSSGGGSSSMQRGANYFFGFLITFVALLLLFVGCGVGSRRRSRRRGLMAAADDPWGDGFSPQSRVAQPEPQFWEPSFTRGGDDWATMMASRTNLPVLGQTSLLVPSRVIAAIIHDNSPTIRRNFLRYDVKLFKFNNFTSTPLLPFILVSFVAVVSTTERFRHGKALCGHGGTATSAANASNLHDDSHAFYAQIP